MLAGFQIAGDNYSSIVHNQPTWGYLKLHQLLRYLAAWLHIGDYSPLSAKPHGPWPFSLQFLVYRPGELLKACVGWLLNAALDTWG